MRRTVGRVALVAGLSALLVQPGAGQQPARTRVRGYVVDVQSPDTFTLDDVRITDGRTYRVTADGVPTLGADIVRVGADVEVEGHLDSETGEFRAATVKRQPPPEDKTPTTTDITSAVPIEPGERKLWNWWSIKVKPPNFDRRRSGAVSVQSHTFYDIIPSAEIQQYIAALGSSLVPAYQRDLPEGDPAKIPFRFFVVRQDDPGAIAVAGGVVMVFSRTFQILENEAQLASLLAHEIAHLTQKHLWRLDKMPPSPVKAGYVRSYENQADRLGLEYAIQAGYDPREAAATWKLMARKLGYTPLYTTHENFSVRRAFIMGELEARYALLDFSGLRRDADRYTQIAARVKKPF